MNNSSPHEKKEKEIDRIIETIGYTKYHLFLFIVVLLIGFSDGIEIIVLNLIMKSFEDEWNLGKFEKGLIVASAFIGILIGSLVISKYMDQIGRKPFIQVGVVITLIFGYASTLSNSYLDLSLYRLLMGIGIGSKMSSSFTLVTESLPNKRRSLFLAATITCIPLGAIYVCILGMNIMPNFEKEKWRELLLFCVLPTFFCLFTIFFILESVRFLFVNEKYEEATKILYKLGEYGNYEVSEEEINIIIEETRASELNKFESNFSVLFEEKFKSITIHLSSIWFIIMSNFSISNYVLPIVLINQFGNKNLGGNLFKSVLIASIISLPMPLISGMLTNIRSLGRIKTMSYSFILGIGFCIMIIINPSNIMIWEGFVKIATGCGFNAMRIYLSEVYPTKIRAIGNGLGNSIGKIANIIAPFLSEFLIHLFGLFSPFIFVSLTTGLAVYNVQSLPFETLGRTLDEEFDETKKIELDEMGKNKKRYQCLE